MKQCLLCKEIKFHFQFFERWHYSDYGNFKEETNLCKKCAKAIAYNAVIDYIDNKLEEVRG